ncbi:transposase [Erwinia tracheiphila]
MDALYPIVYLDCIVVKVRQNGGVINKAVFLAPGISIPKAGKSFRGCGWLKNESAKFWLNVLTELKKIAAFRTS